MSSRQYIKIKPSEDPAVFCPANGYSKIAYEAPSDLYPVPEISETIDEIQLLILDSGDKNLFFAFGCTGGVTVKVYGANQGLVHTEVCPVTCNFALPYGQGYNNGGRSTFYVSIKPTITANSITSFYNNTSGTLNHIFARINAPSLANMGSCFKDMHYLEYADLSRCSSVTSLYMAFYNNYSLDTVILADTLNSCTTMKYAFQRTYSLQTLVFPTEVDLLETMFGAFAYTRLFNFTFPESCPELTDLYQCFYYALTVNVIMPDTLNSVTNMKYFAYQAKYLKTCVLPTSMNSLVDLQQAFYHCEILEYLDFPEYLNTVTTMNNCMSYCYNMYRVTLPLEMDIVTDMAYLCNNCQTLPSIVFPSSLPELTTLAYAINYCFSITSVTMPTSAAKNTTFYNFAANCTNLATLTISMSQPLVTTIYQIVQGCLKLTTLTLPSSLPLVTKIDGFIQNCYVLTTINTVTWGTAVVTAQNNYGLRSLTSFSQPTLRITMLDLAGASATYPGLLTSANIDWANSAPVNNGTYPSIELNDNNLGATELDRIMTALPSVSVATILRLSSNPGYATCTPSIATSKGYTVN